MKNAVFLILLSLILFGSTCNKSDPRPVQNPLIGIWVSSNPYIQYTILNTTGIGGSVKFTEVKTVPSHLLYADLGGIITTYQIISVNETMMVLMTAKNQKITFEKIKH